LDLKFKLDFEKITKEEFYSVEFILFKIVKFVDA